MLKRCKNFFKRKAIHDYDAFLNAKPIECFFSISYTVPEIIKKPKKEHEKNVFTKNLIFN